MGYECSNCKNDFQLFLKRRNNKKLNALELSCKKGLSKSTELIYSYYEKEKIDIEFLPNSNNIFHYISKSNNSFLLVFFYEKLVSRFNSRSKFDKLINLKNQDECTPLHICCSYVNYRVFDVLLDLGVDLNLEDKDGNTPLHLSVIANDLKFVKKLVIRGADKNLKNKKGHKPLELAEKYFKLEFVPILKSYNLAERIFLCQSEIQEIKFQRHDLVLFTFIGLVTMVKVLLSLIFIKTVKMTNSEADKKQDIIDMVLFFVIFLFDIMFFTYVSFKFFFNFMKPQTTDRKKETNLSNIFRRSLNSCLKCRKIQEVDTKHCLICDSCVENFHHHCIWFNTCVTKDKMGTFKFILIFLFFFMALNTVFFSLFLKKLLQLKLEHNFLFFFLKNHAVMRTLFIGISIFFLTCLLIGFYIILGPVILRICCKKNRKSLILIEDFNSSHNN